jgi:DNA modification methylase
MARPHSESPRSEITNVRLTQQERAEMEQSAADSGCATLSEYIRYLHGLDMAARAEQKPKRAPKTAIPQPTIFHETKHGMLLHGDSLGMLQHTLKPKSVNLIVTSPPFGLVRKKTYGNEDADRYLAWFRPFAEGFKRVLKDDGSLVIDIGGSWKQGTPTRSLYHFELLIMLAKEYGFHLCQEHFWWNPSKLPSPAEWVNIRRVRVKDAVNCVWWLSPTPFPKASNRRVLAPYSASMRQLLETGYKPMLRPSGHNISDKFAIENEGSIPPNLLAIANTESNGRYHEFCKANNLAAHPARFPSALPEYFIRFLTNPGDLVVDPFGGSGVTGEVCEALKRKWLCCELDEQYLQGAKSRFGASTLKKSAPIAYQIHSPCSLPINEPFTPLVADGGRQRPTLQKAALEDAEPMVAKQRSKESHGLLAFA